MRTTKVRASVDSDLRARWESRFGYASLSWLMETAMRTVLDDTEAAPSLEDNVKAAIRDHILKYQHNKPSNVNQPASN